MSIFIGDEIVDLAPLFEQMPQNNYLMNALGVFDNVASSTPKVIVSDLVVTNESLLNTPKSRYSSEHDVTKRENGTERLIEIPFFHRNDEIKVGDIQARRKVGQESQETLLDLTTEYIGKHSIAYYRTREKQQAQALFAGTVSTPHTEDVLIDWADVFGVSRMTKEIALTSTTTNPFRAFDEIIDATNAKADGLMGRINRIAVFATSSFFNELRYSTQFSEAYQYMMVNDSANIIFQRRELLPNVSYFSIPGTNIDIIKCNDPLITQFLPDDSAIAVPLFQAGSNIYQNIYGPASTSFELMDKAPALYYAWQNLRERKDALDVISEHSSLPVNHGFQFSTLITQG